MVTAINFIIHKFKIFLDDEKAEVLSTRDLKNNTHRGSLVAQWLEIYLTTQETWVRSLIREDPACPGAAKPLSRNY